MTNIAEPVFTALIGAALKPAPLAGTTLNARLYQAMVAAIRAGRLPDGAGLPSTRAAAAGLGLSRNTVIAAYDLLRAEGLIDTRPGAAPRICFAAGRVPQPKQDARPAPAALSARGTALSMDPRVETAMARNGVMVPGCPDEALFPADLWARELRRVARRPLGPAFGYGSYYGLAELRRALADRLAADRGLSVSPEQIVVLPGTQAALVLLAQALADPGQIAAIEDPGYGGARAAFLGAGLRLLPVPVDAAGADPAALAETRGDLRLIYLTPSNQYPLGRRLSHRRRLEFLAHARESGAVVIEDDYDGEFQWRGQEIVAMQALAQAGEAIYLGTAAKALMPGLRLGWAVLPDALVEPMRRAQRNLGMGANTHAQAALAGLMRSGQYRGHLRRMARANAERGEALVMALRARFGPELKVRLPDGGVQLAIRFDGKRREICGHAALVAGGFGPARLSGFGLLARPTGLVTGFADATPDRIARFTEILARELAPAVGRRRVGAARALSAGM